MNAAALPQLYVLTCRHAHFGLGSHITSYVVVRRPVIHGVVAAWPHAMDQSVLSLKHRVISAGYESGTFCGLNSGK